MRRIAVAAFLAQSCVVPCVQAQGLATWLGDRVGLGGAGRQLDRAHAQIKSNVPVYRHVEEGASGAVRHVTGEMLGETAGPVLARLIEASRSDTIRAGVQPIPPNVRMVLSGFFPEDLLNRVRFRIGLGNDLLIASNTFRYGDAIAITFGDVVMFKDFSGANDPSLWAHELTHVQQYNRWGTLDFAKRYVKDASGVENEAYHHSAEFVAWRNSTPMQNVSVAGVGAMASAQICATAYGICGMMSPVPFGSPCGCPSQWGLLPGVAR